MTELHSLLNKNVGFIGGGNMAKAIAFGFMKKNVFKPSNIWVSSRTEKTLSVWKDAGVNTTFLNYEVIANSDIIFLAVKPHMLDEALSKCKCMDGTFNGKLFVSVLVGVSLYILREKLEQIDLQPRIVRSMPNTPMMVSEGITVYCCDRTTQEDENLVKTLFSQLGVCEKISESLMNNAGALSGAGPAYAYVIIEALADGGVRKGIPRELAIKFAAQVLIGAGKMVLETEKHPGQLKDEVCSPGGSTITGIHEMERGAVRASMINAVEAAANRSDELGLMMSQK